MTDLADKVRTLTEQDTAQLEKLGFEAVPEIVGYENTGTEILSGSPAVLYSPETEYAWLLDDELSEEGWWMLLGILIGVAREKEVSVYISAWHEHCATELRRLGRRVATLAISINATPRQIFDALLEVLSDGE